MMGSLGEVADPPVECCLPNAPDWPMLTIEVDANPGMLGRGLPNAPT